MPEGGFDQNYELSEILFMTSLNRAGSDFVRAKWNSDYIGGLNLHRIVASNQILNLKRMATIILIRATLFARWFDKISNEWVDSN